MDLVLVVQPIDSHEQLVIRAPLQHPVSADPAVKRIQRDVIDRGIFTSVNDLKRKILRYIRLYQKTAKPFAGNTPTPPGESSASDFSGTAH